MVEATVRVLDALGSLFSWDVQQAGTAGVNSCGDPLPAVTLASIRKNKLALKGPLTTPIGEGFQSSNVRLREEFQLFSNVRPALTIFPGRYENIDVVLVRENVGGFYVAHEYYIPVGDDPRAVAAKVEVLVNHLTERGVKMKITTIGIDLAKSVFQIHGVDEHGKVALSRQTKFGVCCPSSGS